MNKVITVVIDTIEEDLSKVLGDFVNALHGGNTAVKQVRVMDDTGEKVHPIENLPGVENTAPESPTTPTEPTPINAPGVPATAPPSSVTDVTTTKQVEGATSDTTPKEPPITAETGGTATGESMEGVGSAPTPPEPDGDETPVTTQVAPSESVPEAPVDEPPVDEPVDPTQVVSEPVPPAGPGDVTTTTEPTQ